MKIVKFMDGTFAIRKFSIFFFSYIYKDLVTSHWWGLNDAYFYECKGSIERVKKEYYKRKDKGRVIKLVKRRKKNE